MIRTIAALALILPLAGCGSVNAFTSAGLTQEGSDAAGAKANIEKAHDLEAAATRDAACNLTYGTIIRDSSSVPGLPRAVEALCGVLPLSNTTSAMGQTSSVSTATTSPAQ